MKKMFKSLTFKGESFRVPQTWEFPDIGMFCVFNLCGDISIVIMISSKNIPRDLETRLCEHFFVGFIEARVVLIFDSGKIKVVTCQK